MGGPRPRLGDYYELAHGLIMLGGAVWAVEPDAAIAALDEGVRIARDSGILSALSIGLAVLGIVLPIEESERMLAVVDEAIAVGTEIGDRISVASATATRGWVGASGGRPSGRPSTRPSRRSTSAIS